MENIVFIQPMIDITFWNKLREKKINELKLEEKNLEIIGFIKPINNNSKLLVDFNNNSFENDINFISGLFNYKINGILTIFNKIEDFNQNNIDKILKDSYNKNKNNFFHLFVFGNLKTFDFQFKFCQYNYNSKFNNINIDLQHEETLFKKFIINTSKDNEIEIYLQHLFLNGNFTYNKENNIFYIFDGFENKNILNSLVNTTLFFIENNYEFIVNKKEKPNFINFILIKNKLFNKKIENLLSDNCLKGEYYFNNFDEMKINIVENNINLKQFLSPKLLSETQNNMHLSLMQWRLEPELRPEHFTELKILILGCGTLGCQIIRNLLGWNIKNFVLIDNSKISYSTPNRQLLYKFDDAKNNKYKAERAAEEIKLINPNSNVNYHIMNIPMPGHFDKLTDKIIEEYNILEKEIEKADVIYNLLDSKEGRYLPTLISKSYNKICFSIGLGYDSYIIVRHNFELSENNVFKKINPLMSNLKKIENDYNESGCFFCSDSVGPKNTMKDRTLDQQCTVTRPGLSGISSANATEILINMIQKMIGKEIGTVPEYLRGTASNFNLDSFISKKSEICMACGNEIIKEWKNDKIGFLKKIIEDPDFILKLAFKDLEEFDDDDILILEDDDFN